MTKFDKRSLICRVRAFVFLVSSGVFFIVAGVTLIVYETKAKHYDKAIDINKDQGNAKSQNHQVRGINLGVPWWP